MNRETINFQRSNLPLPTPLSLREARVRVRRLGEGRGEGTKCEQTIAGNVAEILET